MRLWDKKNKKMIYDIPEVWDEENYVVMKYTGFDSVDGIKIYEKDVIEWTNIDWDISIGLVEFFIDEYRAETDHGENTPLKYCGQIELLGNIYENLEFAKLAV